MKKDSAEHPIAQALFAVVCGICREKESLTIEETPDHALPDGQRIFLITLWASLNDYRMLVGKQGRCVHSMQRIVQRAGDAHQMKAELSLRTNNLGPAFVIHEPHFNPNFDDSQFIKLLTTLCDACGIDVRRCEPSDEGGKLNVFIPTANADDAAIIADFNNLFYSYGRTQGRRIDIKTNSPTAAK